VPEVQIDDRLHASVGFDAERLRGFDLVVILVPQTGVDWELIAASGAQVLDCCNALRRVGPKIARL